MAWVWDKKSKIEKKLKKQNLLLAKSLKIKGYDFSQNFNLENFLNSYNSMGFQGSNLGFAIKLFKEMLSKKTPIYMSFTGNMISSGNRDLITYLVKHNLVKALVTSGSAIEEDIIKSIKPFYLGNFELKGKVLSEKFLGRIGNILAPASHYIALENLLNKFLPLLYSEKKIFSSHEITSRLGAYLKNSKHIKNPESSFLYWAYQNKIPVFCPSLTDGAIGDISIFFKNKHPDFCIDIINDNKTLVNLLLQEEKAGCLILGGGLSKHFLLNAAIFRDGFDYSIYLTTALEYDGSDSGGNPEEAISWAKIKPEAKRVKVIADATITFPILMSALYNLKSPIR